MSHADCSPQAALSLIRGRHSQRAFLPRPVPAPLLREVLLAAAAAPSSKNTQPWGVAVLLGERARAFSARLCALFDAQEPACPDYATVPEWPEGFLERARACGYGLFALKGIDRHDRSARRAHDRENFELFGAPACLILHLTAQATPGTFLDLGCYLQNVMLGLRAHGIGSCPQFSLAAYPDAVRDFIGLQDRLIVCGLSLGYADPAATVNAYVPERLPPEAFIQWLE